MIREQIDFHVVEPHHDAIHARLLNWARWCWDGVDEGSYEGPGMFALYQADNWGRDDARSGPSIDGTDALRIMDAMFNLSTLHRIGLNWWYVRPTNPCSACRRLGVSMQGLAQIINEARTLLHRHAKPPSRFNSAVDSRPKYMYVPPNF